MAKNLYQAIKGVRDLLREDTYPQDAVIEAINRVLRDINVEGPFRFHEAQYTLNLTANNYAYAVPGNVQSELLFVYAVGNNSLEQEVYRKRDQWATLPAVPTSSGNTPTQWARYDDNWYIYPIPNDLMANENITVFYYKDLTEVNSPTDSLQIPDRHFNVIIYGAAAQLRPNLMVASPEGDIRVQALYNRAFYNMKAKEKFDFNKLHRMKSSARFEDMSSWGHSGAVR